MPASSQHTNLSDEELILAYRRDDDNQWLGYLLQRYTTLLLGVALKYLKDKPQAEDAVQQVFIKVLTNLPKEQILNFKGWLYVLMRNHCLQQLRDKTYNTGDEALQYVPDSINDSEEIKWQEHTLQQMSEAIEELNEEQRKSIVLFYLKKYSYEQIIEQTGYTFMQVKSYIQNGKRNLKTILLKKLGSTRQ
ncbi:MAG: sigma-70 family polymerase sigma factor [Flavipsychrobacter sp.]|nr:sigma-70 family polymerase sigma factor [Flavipsychrobacter sp.]